MLNGIQTKMIFPDLTGGDIDFTSVRTLMTNVGLMYQGVKFGGPFEITAEVALDLLSKPDNPNGRPNADVVRLWCIHSST